MLAGVDMTGRRVTSPSPINVPIVEFELDRTVHRDNVRIAVAASEYPRTCTLGGVVLVFFTVLTIVATQLLDPAKHTPGVYLTYLCMAIVLFSGGQLLGTDLVPERGRPWVFALVGALMGVGLAFNVALVTEPYSYAIYFLLLCICGGAILAWQPYLAFAVAVTAMALVTLRVWPVGPTINWLMLTLGAVAVGAVLLSVRLRTVFELADATAETQQLADSDQLTGILNRHGLMKRIDSLWSTASGIGRPLFVVFVDIQGSRRRMTSTATSSATRRSGPRPAPWSSPFAPGISSPAGAATNWWSSASAACPMPSRSTIASSPRTSGPARIGQSGTASSASGSPRGSHPWIQSTASSGAPTRTCTGGVRSADPPQPGRSSRGGCQTAILR